ncbi:aldehyde dehydrogenase [Escherichia coli]|nr:aldehyde dehydrogenase [Escherichia coli]
MEEESSPTPLPLTALFASARSDFCCAGGNDSNLLIVFYVQIMPDDFVMQLHRF